MFVRRATADAYATRSRELEIANDSLTARALSLENENARLREALATSRNECGDLETSVDRADRRLRKARELGMKLEGENAVLSKQLVKLQRELVGERAGHAAERRRADQAQNNFEWARLTLNAAEQRAAELMAHILKSPTLTALEIGRAAQPPATTGRAEAKDVLGLGVPNGDISFEDVGDEVARQEGIEWDAEGLVTYDQRNGNQQQQ